MLIEYLNGPFKGQEEIVIEQSEEKGSPIYITESGKELSINDLNKVFRIKKDPSLQPVNLKELGDSSLVEIESDFQHARNTKEVKTEEVSKEVVFAAKAPIAKEQPKLSLLHQLFPTAKKTNHKINLELDTVIPTVEFYNLINSAIEVSDEEFIDLVLNEIDKDALMNIIKIKITEYYKK